MLWHLQNSDGNNTSIVFHKIGQTKHLLNVAMMDALGKN